MEMVTLRNGAIIAELKEPETDNAGPESATEPPKLTPATPDRLTRLQWIVASAKWFRAAFANDRYSRPEYCHPATLEAYRRLCHYLDGKPSDMTRKEIEDAAAAARDLAAERSEKLDEQEHEAAGKIEDLESEVADLTTRYRAAVAKAGLTPLIEQLERDHSAKLADMEQQIADILLENERLHTELDALANKIEDSEAERDELVTCRRLADARAHELATAREHWKRQAYEVHCKLNVEVGRNHDLNKQLEAATELVSKVEDEREELELAIGRLTCERDELKREVENQLEARADSAAELDELRKRIAETIERTQAVITYCGITVEMLGGVDKRTIERETHGTDSGV